MALKDGDPIPEGYTCVVRERADAGSVVPNHVRSPCDLVDLSTPPKATEQPPGDVGDSVMKKKHKKESDEEYEQKGKHRVCEGDEGVIGQWPTNNNQNSRGEYKFEGQVACEYFILYIVLVGSLHEFLGTDLGSHNISTLEKN